MYYGNNHSLITKKAMRYIASGAVSAGTGGSTSPPFPVGIAAGDHLFIHSYHRSSSQSVPAPPTGFTGLYNDTDATPFTRQYVYYKIADGSEMGSALITNSGGGVLTMSRMSAFRGGLAASFIDATDLVIGNSATMAHGSLAGSRRGMAISFIGLSDDLTMPAYANTINGNWSEAYQSVSALGDDGGMQMQYSNVGISGNVSGGSYTISGARVRIIRTITIKPK